MTRIIPLDADNSSDRAAIGGNSQPGPHGATQNTGAEIIPFPSAFLPDSRAKSREPSIDLRELATGFFLGCFAALAVVLICIGFFGYRALVA